jgi:hypothetical protein
MDYESAVDITSSFATLNEHKSEIMREFIRMMLSDKSVGYSNGFASLLDLALNHCYKDEVVAIDQQLTEDYEQKCRNYEERIAELEAQLKGKIEESQEAASQQPTEEEVAQPA